MIQATFSLSDCVAPVTSYDFDCESWFETADDDTILTIDAQEWCGSYETDCIAWDLAEDDKQLRDWITVAATLGCGFDVSVSIEDIDRWLTDTGRTELRQKLMDAGREFANFIEYLTDGGEQE